MQTNTFHITPFFIEVDGVQVEILEVLKSQLISGDTWYHVVVSINYNGIKSRRYSLDVKDIKDLTNKLKIEITKIKFIDYAYGIDEVKRLIT
ncbi:MAG: hypothetical protein DRI48_08365 [Chloroflexi bacterium]|mgnify:CR=1 FL=1|nr:MAG: hypothetical protein DRI48_08365 [Chloroflexota bacterium]